MSNLTNQLIELSWHVFLENEKPDTITAIKWLADNTCYLDLWARQNGYVEVEEVKE
jgi:hypothetical protein